MEQRQLGRSGLSVSVLSFGTMTVGGRDRFLNMGNLGVADVSRMLDRAHDAGLTTIDTADLYSFGAAEEIIGEAIKDRRDEFVVITKAFMRVGTGVHDVGLSRKHLIAACEASLRRLQTDYLDVYMSHEPDLFVPMDETLRAFDDLVTQGKVRYVGCSNHSAWHVVKALATADRKGYAPYVCQELQYSLIGRDIEHELVPMGLDQGIGILAWSPLHYGLLSGKFRRDARPSETRLNQLDAPGTVDLERVYRIVDVLADIAGARGVSVPQVALNWVIGRPGVSSVILGVRTEEQLRDNLAAASWQLSAEEIARLDEVSTLPEPYPTWHQHKFGLERNPRVPAVRADGWATSLAKSREEAERVTHVRTKP